MLCTYIYIRDLYKYIACFIASPVLIDSLYTHVSSTIFCTRNIIYTELRKISLVPLKIALIKISKFHNTIKKNNNKTKKEAQN